MKDNRSSASPVSAKTRNVDKAKRTKKVPVENPITESSNNPPMIEQTITPPAHIWSKIERILDKQDQLKAACNPTQSNFAAKGKTIDSKHLDFAAAAVTLAAYMERITC
jgi:hypothetical protein